MALRTFAARHFRPRTLTPLSGLHTQYVPFPIPVTPPYWDYSADDDLPDYKHLYHESANQLEQFCLMMVAAALTLLEP